jgi:hypothetical protein
MSMQRQVEVLGFPNFRYFRFYLFPVDSLESIARVKFLRNKCWSFHFTFNTSACRTVASLVCIRSRFERCEKRMHSWCCCRSPQNCELMRLGWTSVRWLVRTKWTVVTELRILCVCIVSWKFLGFNIPVNVTVRGIYVAKRWCMCL